MSETLHSPESAEGPQVSNLSQVTVDQVKSELVRMHQSAANEIQAGDVELNMSAVVNVNSANISARSSALAVAQAVEVTAESSVMGAVQAESVSVGGLAGVVMAGNADLNHAHVGLLAGREVRGEKIDSFILLSPRVEGNVTTVMNTREALIAGLVGGLIAGVMLLLGRMLFGRK